MVFPRRPGGRVSTRGRGARRGTVVLLGVLFVVLVAIVVGWGAASVPAVPDARPNPVTAPLMDAATARAALADLPLAHALATGYERDRFGQRWADVDRNGCDTRNDVLARDLSEPEFRDEARCVVVSGVLVDPYDGQREQFTRGEQTSPRVQIDHIVALAWAWRHGADQWSDAQREAFANDPANLVATADENNGAKSDAGPAEWLPPSVAARCGFLRAWVGVVDRYGLSISEPDRDAAEAALAPCS